MSANMEPLIVINEPLKCKFCKVKEIDVLKYGPLYKLGKVRAHYFCVLLSSSLVQNGSDQEGMLGFLLKDIKEELRRSKTLTCYFCGKKNATIKCWSKKCPKRFHLPCGLQNGSLHQFMKEFKSFCRTHRPVQSIPQKILSEAMENVTICCICYDTVEVSRRAENVLWAPCCKKTWYHRLCVQKLAQSAGYLFKCAACNNGPRFRATMERHGIYVPQQDASWERVPNAFSELLHRHDRCDAEVCHCPEGRRRDEEDTMFEIILCRSCGAQGVHVLCGGLQLNETNWECSDCRGVATKGSHSKWSPEDARRMKECLLKKAGKSSSEAVSEVRPFPAEEGASESVTVGTSTQEEDSVAIVALEEGKGEASVIIIEEEKGENSTLRKRRREDDVKERKKRKVEVEEEEEEEEEEEGEGEEEQEQEKMTEEEEEEEPEPEPEQEQEEQEREQEQEHEEQESEQEQEEQEPEEQQEEQEPEEEKEEIIDLTENEEQEQGQEQEKMSEEEIVDLTVNEEIVDLIENEEQVQEQKKMTEEEEEEEEEEIVDLTRIEEEEEEEEYLGDDEESEDTTETECDEEESEEEVEEVEEEEEYMGDDEDEEKWTVDCSLHSWTEHSAKRNIATQTERTDDDDDMSVTGEGTTEKGAEERKPLSSQDADLLKVIKAIIPGHISHNTAILWKVLQAFEAHPPRKPLCLSCFRPGPLSFKLRSLRRLLEDRQLFLSGASCPTKCSPPSNPEPDPEAGTVRRPYCRMRASAVTRSHPDESCGTKMSVFRIEPSTSAFTSDYEGLRGVTPLYLDFEDLGTCNLHRLLVEHKVVVEKWTGETGARGRTPARNGVVRTARAAEERMKDASTQTNFRVRLLAMPTRNLPLLRYRQLLQQKKRNNDGSSCSKWP